MYMNILGILIFLILASAFVFWLHQRQEDNNPPIYMVANDNEEINAAMTQAHDTLEQFLTVLQTPESNQSDFEIKIRFDLPDGAGEYIWVNNLHFEEGVIHGLLYNDPVFISGYSFGDPVSVHPNEIKDWKYVENGKLVGGYTIRIIFKHLTPEEHEEFAQITGYRIH